MSSVTFGVYYFIHGGIYIFLKQKQAKRHRFNVLQGLFSNPLHGLPKATSWFWSSYFFHNVTRGTLNGKTSSRQWTAQKLSNIPGPNPTSQSQFLTSGSNWCWQQTESEVSNHNTGASPSFFPCAYQKSNPRHTNKPKRKKKKRDDGYRTEHHIHGELRNPLCLAGYPKSLPNLLLQRLKLYCLFLLFLLSIS